MVQAMRDPIRAGLAAYEPRVWHAPAGKHAVSMEGLRVYRLSSTAADFCVAAPAHATTA